MISRRCRSDAVLGADKALRLSEAQGAAPGYWFKMQTQRDFWLARLRASERVTVRNLAA